MNHQESHEKPRSEISKNNKTAIAIASFRLKSQALTDLSTGYITCSMSACSWLGRIALPLFAGCSNASICFLFSMYASLSLMCLLSNSLAICTCRGTASKPLCGLLVFFFVSTAKSIRLLTAAGFSNRFFGRLFSFGL